MFKMISCGSKTFNKLKSFCKSDNGFSQENLSFCGIWVASHQNNMIDDDPTAEDFYWCRKFLKWIF